MNLVLTSMRMSVRSSIPSLGSLAASGGVLNAGLSRREARGARHERFAKARDDWYVYEPEYMKLVLEDLCAEAGVKFSYHTSVVAAYRDASGRNLETVVTESKAGRCISGDFLSQASYRVTGPAVEMAEGVVRRIFSIKEG